MSYRCLIMVGTDKDEAPAPTKAIRDLQAKGEEPTMTTTTIPESARTDTRERRGLELYRERGEEIKHVRGSVWSVPSCTRAGVYLVDLADSLCTCADMPRASLGEVCKHTTAATIARAKSGVCAGCGLRCRRRHLVECVEGGHDGLTYFDGDLLCRTCADAAGVEH
jgi:hypothetical protein